jgi:predicted nucleic acid-binding protein
MRVLVDTNILLRRVNRKDPSYSDARRALNVLRDRGDQLCIFPQIVVEFWSVCTRPVQRNGLGVSAAIADRITTRIEAIFDMLPDTPDAYAVWRVLVKLHGVSGLKVYDARLVASARVHGIGSILTFNDADFRRFPDIEAVHPSKL